MRLKSLARIAASCSIIALSLESMTADAQPNLLDLGVGKGCGINNSGQAVIQIGPLAFQFNMECTGTQGASIYSNGTLTPIGMNGVTINAGGEIAGEFTPTTGLPLDDAALYSNGNVTLLQRLPNDVSIDSHYSGLGINAGGTVVGSHRNFIGTSDGVVWSNGTLTDIGTFPGGTYCNREGTVANAINDSGQITGSADATLACNGHDAFIYDNGTWTDLGPGSGTAINASGQVTGVSQIAAPVLNTYLYHAFIYGNGTMTDLGVVLGDQQSEGFAINATGNVVGRSQASNMNTGVTSERAFYYNGVMNDLNAFVSSTDQLKPFVKLTDARGINDNRLIVVNGVDSRDMQEHA